MTVVAVAVGGAAGALLRWWLSRLNGDWPRGTFAANMVGCLALGVLVGSGATGAGATGLGVGVLGGLTTFSTFAVEVATPPGRHWRYLAATVFCGAALAALGLWLGGL